MKYTRRTIVGSTGHESPVDVVSKVTGVLPDGRRLELHDAIVTDFPPVFEQHQIAGLLSPQLLAATGEVAILDLAAPRLTFRRDDSRRAVDSDAKARFGVACTNADSPFRNRLYASDVLVDGAAARLLIDTGATRTMVAAQSRAGIALAPRDIDGGRAQGVGGAAQATRRVPSVALTRGGSIVNVDIMLGAATNNCGPDGLLGMDALAGCVLLLASVVIQCSQAGADPQR